MIQGRVLVVAGSDSGGGAGVQADLKTVQALGGYATTAVTAVTVQDTFGVHGVHLVPPEVVRAQMEVVLADIGADVVKAGMLGGAATVAVVGDVVAARGLPLVLDPVMVAKGGAVLMDPAALQAMRRLIGLATVLTPNVPEAEALLARPIPDHAAARAAAVALLALGAGAVLLKGGHLAGEVVRDVLATPGAVVVVEGPRIETRHTHGTGCTLASAVAVGIAQGMGLEAAVRRARAYVERAIAAAPGLGGRARPAGTLSGVVRPGCAKPRMREAPALARPGLRSGGREVDQLLLLRFPKIWSRSMKMLMKLR